MDELALYIAHLLGVTPLEMAGYLLTLVTLAPLVSWLRPRVDPVLSRWRDDAALTRTTADDRAVLAVTLGWSLLVWLPAAALRLIPIFATQDEVDALQAERRRRRPPSRTSSGIPTGMLVWGVLISGALLLTSTGCATGRPPATPLHRAGLGAVVLVDAGTFAAGELERVIEADLTEVRTSCLAAEDASRDCDAAVRHRAIEYQATVAAHALYAELVNQLAAELRAQARRQQAGEEVDLGDALRLTGRALAVYRALAETLRHLGVELPPLPLDALTALGGGQ